MPNSSSFVINPSDFDSVELAIRFQNLTSRNQPVPSDQVTLQEVSDDGMTLGLPHNCCNTNHSVEIELIRRDPTRSAPLVLRATGKVVAVETTDDPVSVRVKIALKQFDEGTWKTFVALNDSRQQAINRFIREACG